MATDGATGVCLQWDGTLRAVPFGPGAHIISTDRDLDDPSMPEVDAFREVKAGGDLPAFVRNHGGSRPVCKHGDSFGTVSSTLYLQEAGGPKLLYAAGPPCRTPFDDFSKLLKDA